MTLDGKWLLPSEEDNCQLVEVTEEDVAQVVTSIPKVSTLILIKTMLKKHSFQVNFFSLLYAQSIKIGFIFYYIFFRIHSLQDLEDYLEEHDQRQLQELT